MTCTFFWVRIVLDILLVTIVLLCSFASYQLHSSQAAAYQSHLEGWWWAIRTLYYIGTETLWIRETNYITHFEANCTVHIYFHHGKQTECEVVAFLTVSHCKFPPRVKSGAGLASFAVQGQISEFLWTLVITPLLFCSSCCSKQSAKFILPEGIDGWEENELDDRGITKWMENDWIEHWILAY